MIVLAIAGAFLFAGCVDEAQNPAPPSYSAHAPSILTAKLSPDPLTLTTPISVIIDAMDHDRNPLTFRYQWVVNDRPMTGETGHELSPAHLKRGDRVKAVVTAMNGMNGLAESNPVETVSLIVGNTPPVVSTVAIEPEHVHAGDRVEAKAEAIDADRDDVTVIYRWRKNGEVFQEGAETILVTTEFKAGDLLQVEAIPRDGQAAGHGLISTPVLIAKALPKIHSQPPTNLAEGRYEYSVLASAAEGETLQFSLETGPPGMVIDAVTGRLVWQATKEQLGSHRVKVVVQDGTGGTAYQEFDIRL